MNSESNTPLLKIKDLGIKLGSEQILTNVNMSVESGSIHALIGPNGAGKTTVIRCIMGGLPHTGEINFQFHRNARIGYVPQFLDFDRSLPLTVCDFFRMMLDKKPSFMTHCKHRHKDIHYVLSMTDSEHLSQRKIGNLSGGEFRRVLLAQALSPMPEFLMLDEPASSVDEFGAKLFESILLRLCDEHKLTILIVSHDLSMILRTADSVTGLNRRVIYQGAPEGLREDNRMAALFTPHAVADVAEVTP